ncbi:MAG: uncharacterized SAM-binding protein YcdF (DUF218 family) [Pseudomonadales bacterium]|jgi:uncharacterized SAM-binding protein YcdF (DUF218 family)
MFGLLRDWLLDPAALLFLASIALGLVLIVTSQKRLRTLSTQQSDGKRQLPIKITGIFSVRTTLFVVIWLVGYALVTAPILVNPMVNLLERLYLSNDQCAPSSHVVLLSGGVGSRAQTVDSIELMSPATFVRATEASRIIAKEPDAKLIVSGGVMYRIPEAEVIARYLTSLGVPEENLILESKSRNTYENAVNVATMLATEDVQGPVRLVTSAMHMHRAFKSFELALSGTDISICPISVDFKGLPDLQLYGWMPQMTALIKFDHMLHELVALLMYRLKGWI